VGREEIASYFEVSKKQKAKKTNHLGGGKFE
jgi:hypothetical protein